MAHCSMLYYYTKWNIIENVWFVHLIHKYLLDFILFLPNFIPISTNLQFKEFKSRVSRYSEYYFFAFFPFILACPFE